MSVKQISIFLENKSGRLAEVTKILGDGGINLRAITIADTADFGILRLIADDPDKALKILESGGFTAKVTEVLAVEVPDSPGGLAKAMAVFSENAVNIEYLYASLEHTQQKAVIIFKVEELARGQDVLSRSDMKQITSW
jgi:hypothetical protein